MQFKTENNPHSLISLLKNTGQRWLDNPNILPALLWYWVVFENWLPARDHSALLCLPLSVAMWFVLTKGM